MKKKSDDLAVTLTRWRERARTGTYVDAAPFFAQLEAVQPVTLPEVGDEASIPCPHCDGPMTVVSKIHDSIIVECPKCSQPTKGTT